MINATSSVIRRSMRLQWTLLRRDRRAGLLGLLLLMVLVTALASGIAREVRRDAEQARASTAEQHVWESQNTVNPHNAAHFGRYVFKPSAALAALDAGLTEQLGGAVQLEAHRQGIASQRPAEQGTIFSRFGGFSFALALQLLAPLVIILIGFTIFSGGPARALLVQELGGGADPRQLMIGRLLGLGVVVGALLALLAIVGVALLAGSGSGSDGYIRLGWLLLGYALYLLCFLALTLGVSALCRDARRALVLLLGFWLIAVVLVPRVAPAIADHLRPAPSALAINEALREQTKRTSPGARAVKAEVARQTAALMRRHGVARPDQLPYGLGGLSLTLDEAFSTRLYRAKFEELYRIYAAQAKLERWFALVSPTVALRPFSAAMADADFGAHQHWLRQAEDYRYQVIQALNREQFLRSGKLKSGYTPDIRSIDVGSFTFAPRTGSAALGGTWPDLLILAAWAGAALLLAFWAAARLARNP